MKQSNQSGAALVVTLIVLTALAVVAVAMISNTSLDRIAVNSSANIFRAQLAAEAGLQTALTLLRNSAGPNMTLSLDRTDLDSSRWSLLYNTVSLNGTILSSNSSLPSGIVPIGNHTFALPTGNRTAPKFPIPNPANQTETIGSFSYVVIDNTAKQCLARFPQVTPRAYAASLNEVPFITASLNATSSLNATTNQISSLLSPASANLLYNQDLGINSKWVDTKSYSPNLAPDGGPKLNLRRLKFYVDSLAITQSAGNPKAQAIEALLGQNSTVNATTSWGGGGLTWLTSPQNPRPYTLTEARQIAANLIDYIDDDLHPTTDNVDNPTYFGTEGRLTANGTVQGHPYVTAVGCGLVFNRSSAGGSVGQLNSTRVLSFWSLVNPWSQNITSFHTFYSVNVTITVNGTATGGNLGGNASAYFQSVLNERLNEGPATGGTSLNANSGSTFPQNPSGLSYANNYDMRLTPGIGRQPAGMTFSNIRFIINRMRLTYTDTSGRSSVVQILDRLNSMPIPLHLNTFTLPSTSGSLVYNPGTVRNGLFLNGDPRLNLNPNQWVAGNMTEASAISNLPPEKTAPAVNMFSSMNATRGDGAQGLTSNHTWYSSSNTTNHFFVRSPPLITANPANNTYTPVSPPNGQVAMESQAEAGYLSTGRPWQTLRMVVDPANIAAAGDYSILDFIDTGTMNSTTVTTIAMSSNTTTGNQSVTNGRINPNTLLLPTATGLFQNIPGLSANQTTSLASLLATSGNPAGYPFTRPGTLGALPDLATPGATTKFRREDLMRRIFNLLTTQSTEFTVLSHGESINPRNNQVLSSTTMESTVRVLTVNGTTTHTITSRKIE